VQAKAAAGRKSGGGAQKRRLVSRAAAAAASAGERRHSDCKDPSMFACNRAHFFCPPASVLSSIFGSSSISPGFAAFGPWS